MSAPAVVIVLPLEGAPQVMVNRELRLSEHARLTDWLDAHPSLLALVRAALELEAEARAA